MRLRTLHTVPALALLLPCLLAGCYIKVNKGANGEDKDVDVHLPAVGVQVHQGAPSASDMGLPNYPGAASLDTKDDSSANVHVGFGDWQITVRVAKYQTSDAQAKVVSFYRTALAKYGDVIQCQDGQAVGSPSVTHEGLGCDDKHHPQSSGLHINEDDYSGYSLRAGSKRHQHIVAIKPAEGSGTRFVLVNLDLRPGKESSEAEE
jgi:hypothetical protein